MLVLVVRLLVGLGRGRVTANEDINKTNNRVPHALTLDTLPKLRQLQNITILNKLSEIISAFIACLQNLQNCVNLE